MAKKQPQVQELLKVKVCEIAYFKRAEADKITPLKMKPNQKYAAAHFRKKQEKADFVAAMPYGPPASAQLIARNAEPEETGVWLQWLVATDDGEHYQVCATSSEQAIEILDYDGSAWALLLEDVERGKVRKLEEAAVEGGCP